MPTLDTNVLIRYIVEDDPEQTRAAHGYITRYEGTDSTLFIPTSVVLEVEWVLRTSYDFSKETVTAVMSSLLDTRETAFENEAALEIAMFYYRGHRVDFADCLHLAAAHIHRMLPMMTFDRRAARLEGVEGLK